MRLIDADRLKAFLEMAHDTGMLNDFNKVVEIIDEQPIVYDMDKVVEQLNELNDNEITLSNIITIVNQKGWCGE